MTSNYYKYVWICFMITFHSPHFNSSPFHIIWNINVIKPLPLLSFFLATCLLLFVFFFSKKNIFFRWCRIFDSMSRPLLFCLLFAFLNFYMFSVTHCLYCIILYCIIYRVLFAFIRLCLFRLLISQLSLYKDYLICRHSNHKYLSTCFAII